MTASKGRHLTDPMNERSVNLVVLHRDTTGNVLPVTGGAPVDLQNPAPLPPETVAELLDASVRLVGPGGVPVEAVDALAAILVPPAFATSPWLWEHRALIFHDGRCPLGALEFRYDPTFGVFLDNPGP